MTVALGEWDREPEEAADRSSIRRISTTRAAEDLLRPHPLPEDEVAVDEGSDGIDGKREYYEIVGHA